MRSPYSANSVPSGHRAAISTISGETANIWPLPSTHPARLSGMHAAGCTLPKRPQNRHTMSCDAEALSERPRMSRVDVTTSPPTTLDHPRHERLQPIAAGSLYLRARSRKQAGDDKNIKDDIGASAISYTGNASKSYAVHATRGSIAATVQPHQRGHAFPKAQPPSAFRRTLCRRDT